MYVEVSTQHYLTSVKMKNSFVIVLVTLGLVTVSLINMSRIINQIVNC